ncbi:sigma-70 family RNA polymerase sigma factor [Paenibacillus sp. HJL G12]|uniref:Sigma-70 family RNA polymerase sigma factor n=2 Tax=Paenibacillus dendrobii TaxID=2691084 RepID=A0A7X3LFR1_9BACL|nr:sigma-70 family RNA polymerase sigma factor [Paenibacillus dendrobii]
MVDWEAMDDSELVVKAQTGSQEAFGELVRRHRSKVFGYARSMVQEVHAAEDIVQDALIRAFLHLGKLVDVERFLPWMHRIVRNQAMSRFRREGQRQETSFTTLGAPASHNHDHPEMWDQLDYVLERVSLSMEKKSLQDEIPEERLMRLETQRMLLDIISCLKPRERQIFESHFFNQLSPQEIAKEFSLSSANVYQILSRSRKKVIQERIRVTVDSYIRTRRDWGIMSKVILSEDPIQEKGESWSTAGNVLHALAKAAGKNVSPAMVMGLTGLAFRMNILPENVHIAGPTAYDFADVFPRGLRNLGLTARVVDGMTPVIGVNANLLEDSAKSIKAIQKRDIHHALPEALDVIHHALDRGYPVMAWDLCIPEFGMVYGYDDERRVLFINECGRKDTLDYHNLGRGVLEEIFVLAVDASLHITFKDQLREAFHMIIEHYKGNELQAHVPAGAVKGISAYDAWCEAFRNKKVEPNGNAYNIAVFGDSKKYAAQFLSEVASSWNLTEDPHANMVELLVEAAETYRQTAEVFRKLHALFPYPTGGEPNGKEYASQAITLLEQAKSLEIKGVQQLEQILKTLN